MPLAGGDTAESPGGKNALVLADIVLIGYAPKGKALRRSGAFAGDALYVTGQLGGAAAELAGMLRPKKTYRQRENHRRPPSPVSRTTSGRRRGASAARRRHRMHRYQRRPFDRPGSPLPRLWSERRDRAGALPIHPLAARLGAKSALHAALHGGEDYELLFTAPSSARMPTSLAGVPLTRIGSSQTSSLRTTNHDTARTGQRRLKS